jgi:hypothetical protein
MKTKIESKAQLQPKETTSEAMAKVSTTPECLSASVLTLCQKLGHVKVTDLVGELKRQTAAVHNDDMQRAESMLIAQAHTLDGLFARLASNALTAERLDVFERYMRLALKALAELKAPKQVAFVKQANIGNQLQVNNGSSTQTLAHAREFQNGPNELLEAQHGERLDTRAASTTSCDDSSMATMEKKLRPH